MTVSREFSVSVVNVASSPHEIHDTPYCLPDRYMLRETQYMSYKVLRHVLQMQISSMFGNYAYVLKDSSASLNEEITEVRTSQWWIEILKSEVLGDSSTI